MRPDTSTRVAVSHAGLVAMVHISQANYLPGTARSHDTRGGGFYTFLCRKCMQLATHRRASDPVFIGEGAHSMHSMLQLVALFHCISRTDCHAAWQKVWWHDRRSLLHTHPLQSDHTACQPLGIHSILVSLHGLCLACLLPAAKWTHSRCCRLGCARP